jgi:RES domain-containing protein
VVLWRISNHLSLAGDGGMRASGRWHSRGRRIVYCTETPAAAVLEVLVHFELDLRGLPVKYRLLKLHAPDNLRVDVVRAADLPADWPEHTSVTRAAGNRWLQSGHAPLLRVPSAVVPETFNVLLNPSHSGARRVSVVHVSEHAIDPRLLK